MPMRPLTPSRTPSRPPRTTPRSAQAPKPTAAGSFTPRLTRRAAGQPAGGAAAPPPRGRRAVDRPTARGRSAIAAAWLILLLTMIGPISAARAWHDEGHVFAATAAVESLPDAYPLFFRRGAETIAHLSIDPDVQKHEQSPTLRETEYPEHFIDLEMLEGEALPRTRKAYHEFCARLEVDPAKAGTLPYAIVEWAERLALAVAEHRRAPEVEAARQKCLIYAGLLSHYTADLAMPLHLTIHWDGRAKPDGSSPRTGIHARIDALPTHYAYDALFDGPTPYKEIDPSADALWAYVLERIHAGNARVDEAYALEDQYPEHGVAMEAIPEPVTSFTRSCMEEAASVTAAIFDWAWRRSAKIEFPWWLDRSVFDGGFARDRPLPQPKPNE